METNEEVNLKKSLLTITLEGSSMFPNLFHGDKALVKKVTKDEIAVGDIIVWKNENNGFISHRIISLTDKSVITKGDFCNAQDSPIEYKKILGKIVAILRDNKFFWINKFDNKLIDTNMKNLEGNDNSRIKVKKFEPLYKNLQVLDLREISVKSINKLGYVEDVKVVLLSTDNFRAWDNVKSKNVGKVIVVDNDFRVYTGQPEILPEVIEFITAPLKIVIVGQLFLTQFEAFQIKKVFDQIILYGQIFVNSFESQETLQSLTKSFFGGIKIIPKEHVRWVGESILGPEFLRVNNNRNLIALGELAISERQKEIAKDISIFHIRNTN